jgi:hypothetical protein
LIDHILGFRSARVRSAYLIPFPAPRGGWLDHVRLKVFSDEGGDDVRGEHVEAPRSRERYSYNNGTRKYLVRRAAPPRLFFPLATMATALAGREPLWLCEGPKKALAVAQLGLPTIAIESPWSWHVKGSKDLLADFDEIGLRHRVIELVPDGDYFTNPAIARAWLQLADAFRTRGARPRVVRLPETAP